ncbi:transcription elongation factor A protein 2-like [Xenopus laevis]|uniref:Transcription elongation factor A protein 2-like n=1 Tax=Xenopus laevis TaxID=8355 RepID=A0A8J1LZW8_XENLA|nr:transcription elongation factor A protein 2-like [Xenopus laevis]
MTMKFTERLPIDPLLPLFQSTHVGMSVNALRKQSNNNEIITLSKSLIKSWKKLLDGSEQPGKEKLQVKPTCSKELGSSKKIEVPKTTAPSKMARSPLCQSLLFSLVFRELQNTDMKYKNRIRSRISNLKDSKNPDLRKNVLCGIITPEQIAIMSATLEMASNELKEMRKEITKASIQEHQMGKTGGTQSDLFTCGKCKKKNCTYTQVQTRSADEPMTTFVVCNQCGNRWKVRFPLWIYQFSSKKRLLHFIQNLLLYLGLYCLTCGIYSCYWVFTLHYVTRLQSLKV